MKIVKIKSESLAFNLISQLDKALPTIGEELRPLVGARRSTKVIGHKLGGESGEGVGFALVFDLVASNDFYLNACGDEDKGCALRDANHLEGEARFT